MVKQGKAASHVRPVKKKHQQDAVIGYSSGSSSSSKAFTEYSHARKIIKSSQLSKPPLHTNSWSVSSTLSTSSSARPVISNTLSRKPSPSSFSPRNSSLSKHLSTLKGCEFHVSNSPNSSPKQQRPSNGTSPSSVRTRPSHISPKPLTMVYAPDKSPSKPNRLSRKSSMSDLRIDIKSVSSVDSTSSAESECLETSTSHVQTAPINQFMKTFLLLRHKKASSKPTDSYLNILNDNEVLLIPPQYSIQKQSLEYTFSRIFDESTTRSTIFNETCMPMLTPLLLQENYKALIFSHGNSKSGNTHSIIGSPNQTGILPRALRVLFNSIAKCSQEPNAYPRYKPFRDQDVEIIADENKDSKTIDSIRSLDQNLEIWLRKLAVDPIVFTADDILAESQDNNDLQVSLPDGMNYSIWMSCAEICSEKIYDLLATSSGPPARPIGSISSKRPQLFLATDPTTHQKYIQNLHEINIRTIEEAMLVLQTGYRQQQLYSTRANRPLSKGHCVVTIKVLKTPQFGKSALEDAAKGKTSISKLSIVDLAGSEHAYTTTTGNQQLKDLEDVDTSLMVLGHCLKVLRSNHRTGSKIPQIVPYRQSKLTQLFQGLLHASPTNLQVSMLVSVNPSRSKFDETARTLEFASSPIESSRARVIDTSDKSSLSLSNTNNPSINPTLITPLAKNTDIENGKSWDHPIDVESKEMDMVEIKSPLFERRDDAPITSGPILCTSSKCQTVISDMQEDFDRQREAFIMKDRARNQEFEVLNEQIVEHMKMIKDQEMAFQRQDDEIRNLKEMLAESEARRIAQESLRVSMDQEVSALRVQMVDIKNRNKTQEEKIQSQDAEICKLEAALAESITNSEAQNANSILQNEIKLLTDRMADDVKKIKELRERVHSQDENTQHLKNEMSEMEASRLALETTHTVTVQFLEADIERLRVELECTKVTQQDQETVKTMFQRMEEELVKQTRALTESLNFKDQLLVENATKDQELARLREALALSERKGISRLEERLESSDYDQSTIVLVKDLVESENIRLSLETQLAKANEIINAWDKWFVQSPGAKLSHISVHASASSPSAAASSHNSSNNSLIALEKTNVDISTIETLAISEGAKIGSVATGALAVIQDAGVLAVEKAAMQENFIEDINETIASQDVSHDSGGETQESQEICPNKEITPACIEGPKSEYQSSSIKSERSSTVSVDPSQSHVVEFIEIESDSEDHDHRTFNQRRNNAQLEHSHTSTQSNSGSSSNASEEESIKSPKSKSIHPKRKSLRSHSLPGDDETSKFSPRSQPTRVARSRYSLPKNLASSNIRTEALQPLVKKARLSTAAKSSLVFKNNNIEEVQESNQVENDQDDSGEQIPLPHIHRTRTSVSLTSDAEDSTCMPGVQSINGSIKSPNAATTQGLIELPIKDDSGDVDKNTDQSSLSSKYNGQPTDLCLEKITHPGHQRSFIAEENIQIDSLQDSGSKAVPSEQHLQRHTTIENMRANNIHRVEDETAVEFEDENQAGLDHKVNGMMAFDKSYENKSSTLSMATPTRLKSSVFEIDDHVGTPEAEISPIRSLYPKLDSMTPFPRQRSPSLPLYHSQYLIESNNHFADSSKSSEILTEESLAHVESLDQFHAALLLHLRMSKGDPHSRHKPYMNVEYPLKTLESRLSNETGSDSDSGVQWEQCKQVEDINMRSGDENDLQGTTSEYDSAQESLDTEDTGGKENDDPNKTIKQLSEADEAKMKATEFEEQQIEMKQTGQNQDEGFRTMIEQNTMAVASRRPKSKKRKLRQKSTIFAEEMNETVDMFEQPAKKDPHKFLARKARNKIKFK